jgi:hypothetical protein
LDCKEKFSPLVSLEAASNDTHHGLIDGIGQMNFLSIFDELQILNPRSNSSSKILLAKPPRWKTHPSSAFRQWCFL